MFVRTKKGKIFDCNVAELMGKPIYYPKTSKTNGCIDYSEVHKKSENIIDILEVGDYVNGMQVSRFCFNEDGERILNFYGSILELINEDIKSIVTKEMFSSVEYRVETN